VIQADAEVGVVHRIVEHQRTFERLLDALAVSWPADSRSPRSTRHCARAPYAPPR
jgi:hypothetical protein